MSIVCFNGDIINKDEISINDINRCYNFGDGLFETIRIADGKPLFLEAHFKRFFKGLTHLKINISDEFTPDFLEDNILNLFLVIKFLVEKVEINWFRRVVEYKPETNSLFQLKLYP